jgi:hypothetical protein
MGGGGVDLFGDNITSSFVAFGGNTRDRVGVLALEVFVGGSFPFLVDGNRSFFA